MTFFLDFDRTIFDTDRSYEKLSLKLNGTTLKNKFDEVLLGTRRFDYDNPERNTVSQEIERLIEDGILSFEPGELSEFVFDDARRFLEKHGKDSIVVTANRLCPLFQNIKVQTSGVTGFVAEVRVIPLGNGNGKGAEVARAKENYKSPYLFVDDHDKQLSAVQEMSPDVAIYEMRREGKKAEGNWPVIHSFDELEPLL